MMKLKDLISKCYRGNLYMLELMDGRGYHTKLHLFQDLFRLELLDEQLLESEVLFICAVTNGMCVQVRDPEAQR